MAAMKGQADSDIPMATAVEATVVGGASDVTGQVVADASFAPSMEPRGEASQASIRDLERMNMPPGLAYLIGKSAEACAVRYWIVDNSGSMGTQDGKVCTSGRMVSCSRWAELGETLRWHGRASTTLGCHTEFRLLNAPRNGAPQKVVVGEGRGGVGGGEEGAMVELDKAIRSSPAGKTPLCRALREVVAEITALAPSLRAANRVASVIVASDGEASDGDVARAMAPLAELPCVVVIRLCTDEDHVVKYWSEIDADLELELDVLDDIAGEGDEVHEHNPWLAYGEALHRVREFGAAPKILDLLDERALHPAEARDLVEMIYVAGGGGGGGGGGGVSVLRTDPRVDPKDFLSELQEFVNRGPSVFDPSTGKYGPWVDVASFSKSVLKINGGGCSVM